MSGAPPVVVPDVGFDGTQFFWLLLVASAVAMAARRYRIPYALGLVVVGLAIGLPRLMPKAHLDPHVLFTLFLPPLLFEASLNLRTEALGAAWRPIAAFALLGTLLATLVGGGLLSLAVGLPLAVALVFGALIAPTDPISVMAVLKRLGIDHRLGLVVEAESLFNDGVAVVLFTVLLALAGGASLGLVDGVARFGLVVLGGAGLGLLVGALASWVTKAFDDHLLEVTLTTLVAYGAYMAAEAAHVSGVVAVVAAGLVVGNWGMRVGMSPTTRLAVHTFWEYAAFVVNSMVFLLVGIEAAIVAWWTKLPLVLAAVAAVLVGRAVAVYGTAALLGLARSPVPLTWQHLLVWGGLRGALSMALALGLPAGMPFRDELVAMTFGVVLFSLLGQGLTVGRLAARLGLAGGPVHDAAYRTLGARRLAWQAAGVEVSRQAARGALPKAVAAEVVAAFDRRAAEAEAAIAALHLSDDALREAHEAKARAIGLAGARHALKEATLAGVLDDEAADALLAEIDADLAAGGSPRPEAQGA
ncbi:MAG: cation:proton antiporter [Candidatus Sericytochromatia bacterium]|nr:cation:proton antiporter [Candidatus Sericytochromatia bacterium]